MHAYKYPTHERRAAEIAREVGFRQVSASYEVSSLIKFVGRGDTAVADAYLSPSCAATWIRSRANSTRQVPVAS